MPSDEKRETWLIDQFAKSAYFHKKLHEWGMLEVADAIAAVDGARLDWDREILGISDVAWNQVIHRGIRPVTIFVHPDVLRSVDCALAYYRHISMVSQKAMKNIGLNPEPYEVGTRHPNAARAFVFAKHLNTVLSRIIEADTELNEREFELWRGMGAGSQAQGSWQNEKGRKAEKVIQDLIRTRLHAMNWVDGPTSDDPVINLSDGRQVRFAKDPDVGFYQAGHLITLVEVKGGIDSAGVLERFGAMVKSFDHARGGGQGTIKAILIAQGASITPRARQDLDASEDVDAWFTVADLLTDLTRAEALFALLAI